ncbi:hypothetical protein chiPu_0025723, partial [Chiloscyllium punctatum]|nr:hypothetical protein [Chiloscyllium punctatum]
MRHRVRWTYSGRLVEEIAAMLVMELDQGGRQ